ncbi:MAG TPA: hypothetical protein VLI90_12605 [Tepidisphaeraceae bacterium]|nr:hypothetical protein [Tepidisphaeraceae bacterium]
MPIVVACNCGKRFKAGDQFAGKRTKCPGCGQALTIPGGAPAVATAAPQKSAAPKAVAAAAPPARRTPVAAARSAPVRAAPPPPLPAFEDDLSTLGEPEEVFQPAARSENDAPVKTVKRGTSALAAAAAVAPPGKRKAGPASAGAPRFSMSPGMIVLVVLAILIPSTITWVKLGPMKAAEEWNKISSIAEDNISGQIARSLLSQRAKLGFDVRDVKYMPKTTNFQFDESKAFMMIKMPETVPFQGKTTDGNFYGTFHPKTMQFEADVEMMDGKHKLTGSASESDTSLAIDGTAVK